MTIVFLNRKLERKLSLKVKKNWHRAATLSESFIVSQEFVNSANTSQKCELLDRQFVTKRH